MVQGIAGLLLAVAVYGLVWLVNRSLREVEGASMIATLMPGERILLAPVTSAGTLRRGDVVVVHDPRSGLPTVKRVVGLPGEQVALHDGALVIGQARYWEPYTLGGADDRFTWQVGAGEVVVLGDNRDASTDSRAYGPVPVRLVEGRMLLRWRPFSLRSANEPPRPS